MSPSETPTAVLAQSGEEVAESSAPSPQAERVGGRIRDMRRARSFTLVQLAEAAGLSHPFLSQLERGLASPSMASLERIARALGTSQVELLSVDERRRDREHSNPVSVVRAGTGTEGPYSEGSARMLVEGARPFHPMEYLGDNAEYRDSFVHDEDEWMYVLAGHVEVDFDGGVGDGLRDGAPIELTTGDAIYLAGGVCHRLRSADGDAFRVLIVKEHPAKL